jgi:hypothetical protein
MRRLTFQESGLTRAEYDTLKRLTTPAKIQDFLDTIPFNFEKMGDTHYSPRRVLSARRAHCIEGAMLASLALWIVGEPPLVMNLSPRMGKGDFDHVVALFKRGGLYGAISKTNHSVLRYRDPIYRTPRELALSYFHEWFLPKSGEKVLECYSRPLDLRRLGTEWITAEEDTWHISDALSEARHYYFVPKALWRQMRPADPIELTAASAPEWHKSNRRT